jgi:hypothetical protein
VLRRAALAGTVALLLALASGCGDEDDSGSSTPGGEGDAVVVKGDPRTYDPPFAIRVVDEETGLWAAFYGDSFALEVTDATPQDVRTRILAEPLLGTCSAADGESVEGINPRFPIRWDTAKGAWTSDEARDPPRQPTLAETVGSCEIRDDRRHIVTTIDFRD